MMILDLVYLFPLVGIFAGLRAFVSGRKHLLNTLLSLEFVMVNLFWLMVVMASNVGGDLYFSLFFMTLAACEGALGLALLVSIVRTHGNDNFSSFSVLSC
uniref:NADH-ubiquinone oxidoreductase chain 4L n=1 Tax=Alpheus hoplocheles TaxID=2201221 RepID=A0A343XYJ7_9EUCA|nr:NADH dehydrogenase subunit 4L [Alpheus hoplocheles]AWK60859.1 NADH dehydrogenase subunit 4L [Alpheus hoplocheles]